jgi:hypothetical protein
MTSSIGIRALGDGLTVSALGPGCMGGSQSSDAADRGESPATVAGALDLDGTLLGELPPPDAAVGSRYPDRPSADGDSPERS